MTEEAFISSINKYFNYGYITKRSKLIAFVTPKLSTKLNCSHIQNLFAKYKIQNISSDSINYKLEYIKTTNDAIIKIENYLQKYLSNEIAHAIIHGSSATNEMNNYSDFDGLIVLRDNVFESIETINKVANVLNRSCSLMLNIDPLQHHGWMILTEKQLKNWPCSFFPPEILKYSVSLAGFNNNIELNFEEKNSYRIDKFIKHCHNIKLKLKNGKFPENAFQLKSLLSEFMLTPSLYLQTKYQTGIYKKDSFEKIKDEFTTDELVSMKIVSDIRSLWPVVHASNEMNHPKYFTPLTRIKQIKLQVNFPNEINNQLNTNLASQMKSLLNKFTQKIS